MSELRSQVESRFLTITALLVGLFAIPTFFSVVQQPSMDERLEAGKLSIRQPASLEESKGASEAETLKEFGKTTTLIWDCEKGLKTDEQVSGQKLRLVGKNCDQKDLSVINTSNGFTASIVQTEAGFTTDFIHLNEGMNELLIENPKSLQKILLKVTKRSPASK